MLEARLQKILIISVFIFGHTAMACEGWEFYHCSVGNDLYALFLASPTKLIYVHEHGGVNRLKYPNNGNGGGFVLERDVKSAGEQTSIHFTNEGYDYYLYNFISPPIDGGIVTNGVAVIKDGNVISNRICKNQSSIIRCPAYDLLPRAKSNGVLFQYNLDAMSRKRLNK